MEQITLTDNDIILSSSSSKDLQSCFRKYFFRNEMCIAPQHTSSPLQIGDAFHFGLEHFYAKESPKDVLRAVNLRFDEQIQESNDEYFVTQTEENRAVALAMLVGYMVKYKDDEFLEMVPESEFCVVLHEEEGLRVLLAGKMDGFWKLRGPNGKESWWLLEHKTHGETDLNKYKRKLSMDVQNAIYLIAAETEYEVPVSGVLYNLAMKPKLRQGVNESSRAFYDRMKVDYVSRPDNYFQRHWLYRSEEERDELKNEMIVMARELQERKRRAKEQGEFLTFYRNTNSCHQYGQCPYLSICSNPRSTVDTISVGFKQVKKFPELEMEILEGEQ